MELFIVRHGETLWNKDRRLQGSTDISLNDYGRELAVKTGQALKDVKIDKIYLLYSNKNVIIKID